MKKLLMGAWVLIAGLFSCKTTYDTPEDFPKSQIIVGNGGGFAGKEQIYTLLENGQMFHYNGIKETQSKMESLDKAVTKELFSSSKQADLKNIQCNDPGNMYYFVILKKGDNAQKFTWGGTKQEPPAAIKDIYDTLIKKAVKETRNTSSKESASEM